MIGRGRFEGGEFDASWWSSVTRSFCNYDIGLVRRLESFVVWCLYEWFTVFFQCNFLWSSGHIWCHCSHHSTNKTGDCFTISNLCSWVSKSRIFNFASGIIVGFANLVCGFDPSSQNIFLSRMKKKTHQLKILIRRYILFVKVVCRDYWQQLCIIWCPKLISFCKDSRDRDFWKRARFIWYNCRNNHVCSSYMAWKGSLVCQLLLNLRICGSRSGGLLTFFLLFPMGLYV